MAEVKILTRIDLIIYPTPEQLKQVKAITYQAGYMPPRTVYIDSDKYTPELEKEMIKADLGKAQSSGPEILKV